MKIALCLLGGLNVFLFATLLVELREPRHHPLASEEVADRRTTSAPPSDEAVAHEVIDDADDEVAIIEPWLATRENTPPLPIGYVPAYALELTPPARDAPIPPEPIALSDNEERR